MFTSAHCRCFVDHNRDSSEDRSRPQVPHLTSAKDNVKLMDEPSPDNGLHKEMSSANQKSIKIPSILFCGLFIRVALLCIVHQLIELKTSMKSRESQVIRCLASILLFHAADARLRVKTISNISSVTDNVGTEVPLTNLPHTAEELPLDNARLPSHIAPPFTTTTTLTHESKSSLSKNLKKVGRARDKSKLSSEKIDQTVGNEGNSESGGNISNEAGNSKIDSEDEKDAGNTKISADGEFGMKKKFKSRRKSYKRFKNFKDNDAEVATEVNGTDPIQQTVLKFHSSYKNKIASNSDPKIIAQNGDKVVENAPKARTAGRFNMDNLDFTSRIFAKGHELAGSHLGKVNDSKGAYLTEIGTSMTENGRTFKRNLPTNAAFTELSDTGASLSEEKPQITGLVAEVVTTTERTRKRYGWKIRRRNRHKSVEPNPEEIRVDNQHTELPAVAILEPSHPPSSHHQPLLAENHSAGTEESADVIQQDHEPVMNEKSKTESKEEGSGGEAESEKHSHHGEKGTKHYDNHHKHDQVAKGHHDKEAHKGEYDDDSGASHKHEDNAGHYEEEDEEAEGGKKSEHGEHEDYKKGHSTKGGHVIHKKDEYEKKTEFFDEGDDDGHGEKFGQFEEEHDASKGGHHKGSKGEGSYDSAHKDKKGHYSKGHDHSEDKGKDEKEGKETFYEHHEKYGKKSDGGKENKVTFIKGQPGTTHTVGHLVYGGEGDVVIGRPMLKGDDGGEGGVSEEVGQQWEDIREEDDMPHEDSAEELADNRGEIDEEGEVKDMMQNIHHGGYEEPIGEHKEPLYSGDEIVHPHYEVEAGHLIINEGQGYNGNYEATEDKRIRIRPQMKTGHSRTIAEEHLFNEDTTDEEKRSGPRSQQGPFSEDVSEELAANDEIQKLEVQNMLRRHPNAEYFDEDGPTSNVRFRNWENRPNPARLIGLPNRREHIPHISESFQAPTDEPTPFRAVTTTYGQIVNGNRQSLPYLSVPGDMVQMGKGRINKLQNVELTHWPATEGHGGVRQRRYHVVEPEEKHTYHVTASYYPVSITSG